MLWSARLSSFARSSRKTRPPGTAGLLTSPAERSAAAQDRTDARGLRRARLRLPAPPAWSGPWTTRTWWCTPVCQSPAECSATAAAVSGLFLTGVAIFGLDRWSADWPRRSAAARWPGAALLVPGSLTIIRSGFENPRQRAAAIGLWSTASGLALAVGRRRWAGCSSTRWAADETHRAAVAAAGS